MTGQLTNSLPKECDSQKIGRLATKCFHANIPDAWKAQSLDGDDDCGYDFQIQTVDQGEVKDIFRAQLKGKTSPCLNVEGALYSVTLDVSTVNYYCRATEPILLVMCDLSVDEKPKNCHLYYLWIHDDLERVRAKGIPEDQKTITFHVPVANRLDDDTNLSAEIDQFRRIARVGEQLVVTVKQNKPALTIQEQINCVQKIVPGIQQRSASLIDALTDDVDSSWVEAPEGTLPWFIQNARMALRAGNAADTQTALVEAEKFLATAKPIEEADYWHMVGRFRAFELKDEESLAAFEQACRLTDDVERNLIPWGEAVIRLHFRIKEDCDFSEALSRIKPVSPATTALRARLIAAEGRYDEALFEADKSEGIEKLTAQAIIYSMQARWPESLAICEEGLAFSQQRESTKLLFYILKARAKFSLAIGPKASTYTEDRMPLSGPAGTNACAVREAWNNISAAIMALRKAGWPSNLELIADIWSASASILGLQESTLPVIAEAAKARPTLQTLQRALESLAVQANNFKLALEANERLTPDINTMLRRVVLLHQAARYRDCVELFESLKDLDAINDPMLGYAYGMAILSAERGIRSDLAESWIEAMATRQDLAIELAILQYFRTLDQQLLAKEACLAELEAQYKVLGYPVLIAKHLFHELDVMQADPAQRCVELSVVLESDHLLGMDDYLRLAQAFTTLGKWNELLELTNQALHQFDDSDRLLAIGALALDKLGKTAEAHQRLQELINKPDPDHIALNTYINIASVSGFSTDAIRCVEGVLEHATEKEHKLSCLRNLFSLIHLSDPANPRLVEIAWKIGQLADPTDEAQEGLYLMTIFAATLPLDMPFKDEWKEEFQKRLEQFVNRFPNSKILRRASLPQNLPPTEMLKILKEVAGIDEENIRSQIKIQNQLQQGLLPIPFAWRPLRVLNYIPDLPTLWELAKRSCWTDHHLHLVMVLDDWQQVNLEQMRCKTPILDLTTLLVIHDLELFDPLFTIFPRIAIGKATLLEIQHMLSPMSGSPFREKCRALLDQLKSRFQQIEQPSVEEPEEDSFSSDQWFSQEVAEIVKTRRYILYSDDVIFRLYANPPAADYLPSICTLDFLIASDQAEILSARQVAEKIAKLCSWRVGLRIPGRYQYAILPKDLDRTQTISDAIDLLQSDELCNAMFSAIWDFGKEFSQLLIHAGAIISELVRNPNNSLHSVSALAGFWLSKARFNKKAPTPSIKLLALLIVQAALSNELDILSAQRLWSVYRSLTEVVYGNRMEDRNYRDSIEIMAKVTVDSDIELGLSGGNSIFARLNKGLTEGTEDHEIYINEYQSLMIRKSIKKI